MLCYPEGTKLYVNGLLIKLILEHEVLVNYMIGVVQIWLFPGPVVVTTKKTCVLIGESGPHDIKQLIILHKSIL